MTPARIKTVKSQAYVYRPQHTLSKGLSSTYIIHMFYRMLDRRATQSSRLTTKLASKCHFKIINSSQTDLYDSSFGWSKLEEDPLVCVGSPNSQSVASIQAQSQQTCSRPVNLQPWRSHKYLGASLVAPYTSARWKVFLVVEGSFVRTHRREPIHIVKQNVII